MKVRDTPDLGVGRGERGAWSGREEGGGGRGISALVLPFSALSFRRSDLLDPFEHQDKCSY